MMDPHARGGTRDQVGMASPAEFPSIGPWYPDPVAHCNAARMLHAAVAPFGMIGKEPFSLPEEEFDPLECNLLSIR